MVKFRRERHREHRLDIGGYVHIAPEANGLIDLPLLVLFGWYLLRSPVAKSSDWPQ
jgi:hypothetical protein